MTAPAARPQIMTPVTRTRKFFISFTGTITAIIAGRITPEDLADGLFVFGCLRSQFFELQPCPPHPSIVRENPTIHRQLIDAVRWAETENRVCWRDEDDRDAYSWERRINQLLREHGFPDVLRQPPAEFQRPESCSAFLCLVPGAAYISPGFANVEQAFRSAKLPFEVIYSARATDPETC